MKPNHEYSVDVYVEVARVGDFGYIVWLAIKQKIREEWL